MEAYLYFSSVIELVDWFLSLRLLKDFLHRNFIQNILFNECSIESESPHTQLNRSVTELKSDNISHAGIKKLKFCESHTLGDKSLK